MKAILEDSYKPAESLSMVDLLQAEHDNEIQAQHLSQTCGKTLNVCTYSKGYFSQPVFACLTCSNISSNSNTNNTNTDIDYDSLSGFCLGCSMNCHLEHNIIELWNKRHFRCDCGNSKFTDSAQKECVLSCAKEPINSSNKYNHNFIGQYCYCNRAYSASEDTMHQCLVCQDWFHQTCIILQHLKVNTHLKQNYDKNKDNCDQTTFFEYFRQLLIPNSDAFVCKDCAIKYAHLFVPYRWKSKALALQLPLVNSNKNSKVTGMKRKISEISSEQKELDLKRRKLNIGIEKNVSDVSEDCERKNECKRVCLDGFETENVLLLIGGGLWFENEWIGQLCHCDSCNENVYRKYGLQLLFECDESLDALEDRVGSDESVGNSLYDLNIPTQTLSSEFSTNAMIAEEIKKMPRQQTLDALNIMMKGTDIIKQKLFEYIKLNPQKVIDSNDIHNIFKT